MIVFENVSKTYKKGTKTAALEDVNLTIEDGEFVFIVGESGAGKSTLIKLLLGEERPTSGTITVDGVNVGKLNPWNKPEHRRHFGVIFQDFRLLKDYSVYENIAFAQRIIGASKAAMKRRIPKILGQVGLEDKAENFPAELSGGEQQRVALARAIVNGPFYLLADEPTGNLDPAATEEVMRFMEAINRSGTTVIVVTHDAGMVDLLKKRVVTLKDGRVLSDVAEGGYDNGIA